MTSRNILALNEDSSLGSTGTGNRDIAHVTGNEISLEKT
jgi:hypothetical protein